MAGKGDKPRKGFNDKRFKDNFENIKFNKKSELDQAIDDFIDFNETSSIRYNGRRLTDKEKEEMRREAESIFK